MVLPLEEKERLAAESKSSEAVAEQSSTASETHDDIFSFDLPEEPETSTAQINSDPFDFIEKTGESESTINVKSEDDIFADLLESSPTSDDTTFADF